MRGREGGSRPDRAPDARAHFTTTRALSAGFTPNLVRRLRFCLDFSRTIAILSPSRCYNSHLALPSPASPERRGGLRARGRLSPPAPRRAWVRSPRSCHPTSILARRSRSASLLPACPPRAGVSSSGHGGAVGRRSTRCSRDTGPGSGGGHGAACRGGRVTASTPATSFTTRCTRPLRGSSRSSRSMPGRSRDICCVPSRTGSMTSCGAPGVV